MALLPANLLNLNPFHEHPRHGLAHRIAELTKELRPVARALTRQGGEALHQAEHSAGELAQTAGHLAHTAGEFAQDFAERVTPVAREIGRQVSYQGRVAGQMIRKDPMPAVVAIGTVVLLARLFLGRSRRATRS